MTWSSSKPKTVLIADDRAEVRLAVSRAFADDYEFRVCGEAVDGQDAVDKAHELKPDLIILDFSMPVMNGMEAARVLSDSLPAVTMILYTLHTGEYMEAQARSAGFKALVSKSQDISLLVAQARHLLGLLAAHRPN